MKKILGAIIILCVCQAADAQLANTTWTGTVNAGGSNINALLKLTADSTYFYNNEDNSLLDVSLFKLKDSTITLKKVSGLSSCTEAEGVYTITLKGNELQFTLVKDDCYDRSGTLDKATFIKQEEK